MAVKEKIVRTFYVVCDWCFARGPEGNTEGEALVVARRAGWAIIGDKSEDTALMCPNCLSAYRKAHQEQNAYPFPFGL